MKLLYNSVLLHNIAKIFVLATTLFNILILQIYSKRLYITSIRQQLLRPCNEVLENIIMELGVLHVERIPYKNMLVVFFDYI